MCASRLKLVCLDAAGESAHEIVLSSVPKPAHVHSRAGGGQISVQQLRHWSVAHNQFLRADSPATSEHNKTLGRGFRSLGLLEVGLWGWGFRNFGLWEGGASGGWDFRNLGHGVPLGSWKLSRKIDHKSRKQLRFNQRGSSWIYITYNFPRITVDHQTSAFSPRLEETIFYPMGRLGNVKLNNCVMNIMNDGHAQEQHSLQLCSNSLQRKRHLQRASACLRMAVEVLNVLLPQKSNT